MSVKLKVFTFNVRYPTEQDGINCFDNRKEKILAVINEYAPDLIGFQEANDKSVGYLRSALTDYTVIGCGRNAEYRGEGTYIAFRTEVFQMIECKTFWLSPTPDVPASRYDADQSTCPRVTTSALLKHKDAERPFRFINTHLDHKGARARVLEAKQIMEYVSTLNVPCILTGDFNATPDTEEISLFAQKLTDATCNIAGTFHAYKDIPLEEMIKIDYVFTDLPTDPNESFAIPDAHKDGIYISDHRPVCAFIEL